LLRIFYSDGIDAVSGTDDTKRRNQPEPPRGPGPGDIVHPTDKSHAPPAAFPGARAIGLDQNRLERLVEDRVAPLREMLRQKVDQQDHNILAAAAKVLEGSVKQMEAGLDQRLTTRVKPLEDLLNERSSLVEGQQGQLGQRINEISGEGERVKKQLGEVTAELGRVEARMHERFAELQTALDRQTVPDSFFNKTLGAVLGQNIETLQDGNFERLIGERLNQFFQTGVERAELLQDLRVRGERINAALRAVSIQMEKLNSEASVEARQPMQRVEAFVNELSGLQTQMQNRRLTIETTLRVAVSLHTGARQTFLDELGRGIRR
jgi:hypothetical protein